jgi:hypothetical protein
MNTSTRHGDRMGQEEVPSAIKPKTQVSKFVLLLPPLFLTPVFTSFVLSTCMDG